LFPRSVHDGARATIAAIGVSTSGTLDGDTVSESTEREPRVGEEQVPRREIGATGRTGDSHGATPLATPELCFIRCG
jgi:hypothetical protein